jgi:hypothetical protein
VATRRGRQLQQLVGRLVTGAAADEDRSECNASLGRHGTGVRVTSAKKSEQSPPLGFEQNCAACTSTSR